MKYWTALVVLIDKAPTTKEYYWLFNSMRCQCFSIGYCLWVIRGIQRGISDRKSFQFKSNILPVSLETHTFLMRFTRISQPVFASGNKSITLHINIRFYLFVYPYLSRHSRLILWAPPKKKEFHCFILCHFWNAPNNKINYSIRKTENVLQSNGLFIDFLLLVAFCLVFFFSRFYQYHNNSSTTQATSSPEVAKKQV